MASPMQYYHCHENRKKFLDLKQLVSFEVNCGTMWDVGKMLTVP